MSGWLPKSPKARRRLYLVAAIAPVLALAVGLTLWGLSDSISFFYTPAQAAEAKPPVGRSIQLGGLVQPGSVVKHPDGRVEPLEWIFGRPQGLAFDAAGVLHVVEALAGSSGVYALRPGRPRELVVSGPSLVGLAFAADGHLVVASNDTLYGL